MLKTKSSKSKKQTVLKNNYQVTLDSNILPPIQKQFYERAKYICEKEQRPFSLLDFPNIKRNNFRQLIHKLKPLLKVVVKSHPTFYKVKGVALPGNTHRITVNHMVGGDFSRLLETLKLKEPMIHDIRIKVNDSTLYKKLSDAGTTKNPKNGSHTVNVPQFDNNITTKVSVYPNTILVFLGCTYKPLVYDSSTMWHLHEHLSKISYHLTSLGAVLPPVNNWIFTQYHFNKDGSESLSGQTFHYTVDEVSTGMIRFYSKHMPNGVQIPRLEQIRTPNRTIAEEMKEVMLTSDSEVYKKSTLHLPKVRKNRASGKYLADHRARL